MSESLSNSVPVWSDSYSNCALYGECLFLLWEAGLQAVKVSHAYVLIFNQNSGHQGSGALLLWVHLYVWSHIIAGRIKHIHEFPGTECANTLG